MARWLGCVVALAAWVALAACNNDNGVADLGSPDKGSVIDLGTAADKGPPVDMGTAEDATPKPDLDGKLSCAEIQQCAQGCGNNPKCIQACVTKGNAAAKSAFSKLQACVQKAKSVACKKDCQNYPKSPACTSCWQQQCATELTACKSTKPPLKDGGVQPDSGTLSCAEIHQCIHNSCKMGDTKCTQACVAKGTAAAQATFQKFQDCMQKAKLGTCSKDCKGNRQSQPCVTCAKKQCSVEMQACEKS